MLVREILALAAENIAQSDLSEALAALSSGADGAQNGADSSDMVSGNAPDTASGSASGNADGGAESGGQSAASEGVNALLRCYRIIENEVALDYCPLVKTQTVTPIAGKVPYTAFTSAPVNVFDVKEGEKRLRFRLRASYMEVPEAEGSVEVEYAYAPPAAELDDEPAFPARISPRLLAAGVCAEYLLTCGRYSESEIWEGKFREALRAAGVFRKKLYAPRSRRWA